MSSPPSTHTLSLLLHATISASRHEQLLHVLTGICGHPPVATLERHLIFKPATQVARASAADEGGGTQAVVDREKARRRAEREARDKVKSTKIVRYVESVRDDDLEGVGYGAAREDDMQVDGKKETTWSWRFYDVPDPTVRAVNARKTEIRDVSETVKSAEDASSEAEKLGLRFVTQYIVAGSQFIHDNIILLLQKTLLPPSPQQLSTLVDITQQDVTKSMKLLDPSNAYILEARLELSDNPGQPPSNDLMAQGMKEMAKFKELMKGCVDFKTVERMSLNTLVG